MTVAPLLHCLTGPDEASLLLRPDRGRERLVRQSNQRLQRIHSEGFLFSVRGISFLGFFCHRPHQALRVRRSCSNVVACRKGVSTQLEAPSRNCTPRSGSEVLKGSLPLDSLFTGFIGSNTNGFVDIVDEYFAVSDFAGLR